MIFKEHKSIWKCLVASGMHLPFSSSAGISGHKIHQRKIAMQTVKQTWNTSLMITATEDKKLSSTILEQKTEGFLSAWVNGWKSPGEHSMGSWSVGLGHLGLLISPSHNCAPALYSPNKDWGPEKAASCKDDLGAREGRLLQGWPGSQRRPPPARMTFSGMAPRSLRKTFPSI